MCRIVCLFLCVWISVCLKGFSEDGNVLLRINEDKTSLEEFERYYAQSYPVTRMSEERFLTHFLYFKLKVADAKSQGWDTLPDFRLQCRALQEKALHEMEGGTQSKLETAAWIKFSQISIPLPQHVSSGQERRARQLMDSIYTALQQGASFDALSHNYSGESSFSLYQNGSWIPEPLLVKEFAEQLNRLKIGAYSAPFYSPLGIHILRLEGREQRKDRVAVKKETQGSASVEGRNWRDLPDSVQVQLKQITDGLLAAYWDMRHADSTFMKVSNRDLQTYFEAHKKEYAWELPHFKGGVVHCKDKKAASKLKKLLKRQPLPQWNAVLAAASKAQPALSAVAETGLFQIGTNPFIDKLVFKCGHFEPYPDFPYVFVIGKRLKKGPEDFTDVREEVLRDYRLEREQTLLSELERKFKIEINQDILKTVNCSGKK